MHIKTPAASRKCICLYFGSLMMLLISLLCQHFQLPNSTITIILHNKTCSRSGPDLLTRSVDQSLLGGVLEGFLPLRTPNSGKSEVFETQQIIYTNVTGILPPLTQVLQHSYRYRYTPPTHRVTHPRSATSQSLTPGFGKIKLRVPWEIVKLTTHALLLELSKGHSAL